jgi:hypothetical protein
LEEKLMATLNRFPLWGLFAARAAKRIGYVEDEAETLGYATALLYAIFSRHHGGGGKKKVPTSKKEAPQGQFIQFAGMNFQCQLNGNKISQILVGGEWQTKRQFDSQVIRKFPGDEYNLILKAFDDYLAVFDPAELSSNALYHIYATWRDQCKVGFNRVDLDLLKGWLKEHALATTTS